LGRLLHRRDFLAAAKAPSQAMPGVVIQCRRRGDAENPRVGFTCTKKLGNAVIRNRIRRRLREAARLTMPAIANPGCDYVLIGRATTENRTFEALRKDIISALNKLHADS
jgi:ribonuclease P protein component